MIELDSPGVLVAEVERLGWSEALHPRQGGKFAPKGSGSAAKDSGEGLSFNGRTGAGYGHKGGDGRVHGLQAELKRLGFTDASGKALKADGKLGPRTTAAIKKAQRALGLKPDGIATPGLLAKLKGVKAGAKKAAPKKAVKMTPNKGKPKHHARAHHSRTAKKVAPKPMAKAAGREKTYFATATQSKKV